jgi:hypothetical protein
LGELADADALLAVDEQAHGVVGAMQHATYGGDGADAVDVIAAWIFLVGVVAGEEANELLTLVGIVDEFDGAGLPDV